MQGGLIATSEMSVRPSVKRVNCDKTKETCADILIPHYERTFMLVFWQEEWSVDRGERPIYSA